MKRLLFLALSFVSLLTYAQDDMYFTSSKKAKEAAQKKQAVDDDYKISDMLPREPRLVMPVPTTVDYNSNKRSEDEYNRRYVYGGDYQNAGGAEDVADSLAARIEAVGGAEDYYDMDDPELDYRYSRRLVRFHNPRLYVASPYYWDLYYGYGAWDYLYAPYDPWYWHYGWGYGWSWGPWDCWYGGIWGWHHPHAWAYWGWGPSWGIPHYHVAHRNIVPREYNSSRGQMAAGRNIRTNPLGNGTLASRTNVMGARTNAQGNRTTAQGVRGNGTRGSYTDYTNSRTGRSAATNEGARSANTNRARENAAQRSTATRNSNQQPSRSATNQNSSSRVNTNTRSNNTPTNTRSSVPSSSSSFGGGGARSGGGSFGGGGGGGARGGGGGGRR